MGSSIMMMIMMRTLALSSPILSLRAASISISSSMRSSQHVLYAGDAARGMSTSRSTTREAREKREQELAEEYAVLKCAYDSRSDSIRFASPSKLQEGRITNPDMTPVDAVLEHCRSRIYLSEEEATSAFPIGLRGLAVIKGEKLCSPHGDKHPSPMDRFTEAAEFAQLDLPGGMLRKTTGPFSTPPDPNTVGNWAEFWESDDLDFVEFCQNKDRIADMTDLFTSMVKRAGVQNGRIEFSLSPRTQPRTQTRPKGSSSTAGVRNPGVFYAALYGPVDSEEIAEPPKPAAVLRDPFYARDPFIASDFDGFKDGYTFKSAGEKGKGYYKK